MALGAAGGARNSGRSKVDRRGRPGGDRRRVDARGASRPAGLHHRGARPHRRRPYRRGGGPVAPDDPAPRPGLPGPHARAIPETRHPDGFDQREAGGLSGRSAGAGESAWDRARLLGREGRDERRGPPRRPLGDAGDHGAERPAGAPGAVGGCRVAAARAAHRRDGGVGGGRAGGAGLRKVEGAPGHDPGRSRRGPASPLRPGRARTGPGHGRGDGARFRGRAAGAHLRARRQRTSRPPSGAFSRMPAGRWPWPSPAPAE